MNADTTRTRFHLAYSILLLIVIPLFLILNTTWWVRQSKSDTDLELRDKALLFTSTFSANIINKFDHPAELKSALSAVMAENPAVMDLTVYKLDGQYLAPVVSSDPVKMENRLADLDSIPAWSKKTADFSFGGKTVNGVLHRIGTATYPLMDDKDKTVGLVATTLSYDTQDQQAEITFHRSVVILFAAVILTVLLLANHFRLIESTVLLQKLKEIDRMKDDFISMASHELRTPLTAIKGFASMLLEGMGGSLDEKGKHYVDVIMHSTSGLESLVNDMLDVSRIEQGRMTLNLEKTDVVAITDGIVDQLQIPAQGKGLALYHEKPQGPVMMTIDVARMRQIFFNLIGNAVKYTEKGSVTVRYAVGGGFCSIIIQDTGIGMSPEDSKKLFAKFYRIRNEKTEKITGTGLGLWITKQLIEKMSGTVTVESQVGQGSVFTIRFPLS